MKISPLSVRTPRPVFSSLFVLLFFASVPATSQWLKIDSVFSPFGVTAQSFSAPVFADLDDDGDFDLIVGSLGANRIEYFRNTGTKTSPVFRRDTAMFSSIYANGYQFTNSDYPAVGDLDADGDLDLVISGFQGMLMYWNTGDSANAQWQRDSSYYFDVNSYIGTDPKPVFGDLDGDGDLDLIVGIGESLLGGPTAGITVAFRNNGTKDSAHFVSDNSLVTGIPDVGLNAYPALNDWDNDGDLDLVMGRDLQTMIYYKNTGSKVTPAWTATGGIVSVVESSTYWKNPTLCDLDGDADYDLIYGTSDGSMYFYQNVGSVSTPSIQWNSSYFQMIRINGGASTTSLADYDKDGDLDLLSGDWLGGVQYFRNDGTSAQPKFVKTTAPFTSIDAGSYSSPKFIDIDNDGDVDIVAGELLGTIKYYVNTNGSFSANTTVFAGIDVGYRSAPGFVDINNDGNIDMLVGAEESAKFQFYGNSGSNTFLPDNSLFSGVTFARNAHPHFSDMDNDGDADLLLGTSSGTIYYYENTGDKSFPSWKRNDAFFSGVKVPQDAAPVTADLDGDGKKDLIVGEYSGNFSFYKNVIPTSAPRPERLTPDYFSLEQNYPNPFNPATTISFTVDHSAEGRITELSVFDLLGKKLATLVRRPLRAGRYTVTWSGIDHPTGIYLYRLSSGSFSETKKMLLVK